MKLKQHRDILFYKSAECVLSRHVFEEVVGADEIGSNRGQLQIRVSKKTIPRKVGAVREKKRKKQETFVRKLSHWEENWLRTSSS